MKADDIIQTQKINANTLNKHDHENRMTQYWISYIPVK